MDKYTLLVAGGKYSNLESILGYVEKKYPRISIMRVEKGVELFYSLKKMYPTAILLDYMLPDISGLDFLDAIKKSKKFNNVPVLVMSGTYTEPADRAEAYLAGAASFIQIPTNNECDIEKWSEAFCKDLMYHIQKKGRNMKHINDSEFEEKVLKSNLPVLLDFYADWCTPCKRISPIVEEIAAEEEGKAVVYKVNVDENPDTPARLGISSLPALLFFKDGKEMERIIGVKSKQLISQSLKKLI